MELDPRYRFETFVVGSANRLAVAAAHAVAQSPGAAYNPLFVYSSSGLGKTHLLVAIGHLGRQLHPDLRVEYATLEEFVDQFHAAISAGQTDAFKQRYNDVDVLLLDDVQFLAGRHETQSEMLRLFNLLQRSGRQIVLTSDRPPAEISDLDQRLGSRFSGGLIADIGAPDYETRVAILLKKCDERGVEFQAGVVEEVARVGFSNVRELQGALNRLIAYQALGEGQVTVQNVRSLLGEVPEPAPEPTPAVKPGSGVALEFNSFLSDIAVTLAKSIDSWRVRVGEAVQRWNAQGFRTTWLERALEQAAEPDVEALLSAFETAAERLRALEREATAVEASLEGADVFRDPERVAEAEDLVSRVLAGGLPPLGPSPAFTRAEFEVGPSNQLAVHAADAVVEEPGRKYNPLFVHGPSGVGKTHMINAIGNELVAMSGGAMNVACVNAQEFVDELIAALQEGTLERWRARYRAVDAMVIDDIQFFAGKERTQEELFHVFNSLYTAGKQIILSSDRSPKELQGLEERLRSRFEGGLVVEIQPPDRALRAKLYARYLSEAAIEAEPRLLDYLAGRGAMSVREIIGTVHRLERASQAAGAPVTVAFARQELDAQGGTPVRAPTIAERAADAFFLDDEKLVWDWADVSGRTIEEYR